MKKILLSLALVLLAAFVTTANAQLSIRIVKTGVDGGVDVSYDDGEYENDSIDKLYDDDLDMGWEGDDLNIMTTFLRFQDVQIPQGTQIDSAFLIIFAHEDEADEARVTIFAEATDNSLPFADNEAITDRTWGNDSIKWIITENWTMWQEYKTIDLKTVIQGVVNRPGWQAGNALTLFLRGEDQGASLLDNARDFESFENIEDPADGGDGLNHPERIPELIVYGGTLGLTEKAEVVKFDVYPNPAENGVLNIKLQSNNADVYVYDIAGKLVKSQQITSKVSTLDISELNNGVYFVKAVTDNSSYTQKVIVK